MLKNLLLLFVIVVVLVLLVLQGCDSKTYEFIPARCVDEPGVEQKIGGPLSVCSFPPKYETPDAEDIQAVIKQIQDLNLN
ncbi:uncharacterized protein LOC111078803 [Drosophila obscura]|uniref:uncharacterized protein LOC111078803 n=1 Tax=Drosophila obscura TaxID=7282 RepID=UPI001BB2C0AC|nr:uncharacterized protein LOC111078803 [Drosophila obscura]